MTVLIISPSALLRSTLKELWAQVPGVNAVRELGSALQLETTLNQYAPDLVLHDETLALDPSHDRDAGASWVVLQSAPQGSNTVKSLVKPDFAAASQAQLVATYLPLLTHLATAASKRRELATVQVSGGGKRISLVVIGASTGGPAAVRTVLSALPPDFPCPIALVQHIDTGYDAGYAEWLTANTGLNVRLAQENDRPRPGEVIVGPNDLHLVCQGDAFSLDNGPKVLSQKPAVDRLFSSAARAHGPGVLAVLLTGIGSDGAKGCLEIVNAGGTTLVQDEATCTVYGMPRAAAELGAATVVLPLDQIGPHLLSLVRERNTP